MYVSLKQLPASFFVTQMSSKHPITTDTITFGKGTSCPDGETSDYSGSGDPTLVQWRRRPYDTHTYPQSGNATDGKSIGGYPNRLAYELPPPSPTNPVGDLDFDAKLSSTYQSLTDLPRQVSQSRYEDIGKLQLSTPRNDGKMAGGSRQSLACLKYSVLFLGFVTLLAFLIAIGGVTLASVNHFVQHPPQENKISDLETQLSDSRAVIDQLTTIVKELQKNMSDSVNLKNAEIEQLSLQVNNIYESVDGIINPPNTTTVIEETETVNVSQHCEEIKKVETCSIPQFDGTTLPNFSSCTTSGLGVKEEGTYIRDVYCAVTELRAEQNPVIATLRYDEGSDTISCLCFVTALETRRGVVTCALFVQRCNDVVDVV